MASYSIIQLDTFQSTHCAEYIGIPWLQLLFRCEGLLPGAGYPEGGDPSGSHTGAHRQDQVIH